MIGSNIEGDVITMSHEVYSFNLIIMVGNLSDLTVASSRYDILLCSETLV